MLNFYIVIRIQSPFEKLFAEMGVRNCERSLAIARETVEAGLQLDIEIAARILETRSLGGSPTHVRRASPGWAKSGPCKTLAKARLTSHFVAVNGISSI